MRFRPQPQVLRPFKGPFANLAKLLVFAVSDLIKRFHHMAHHAQGGQGRFLDRTSHMRPCRYNIQIDKALDKRDLKTNEEAFDQVAR